MILGVEKPNTKPTPAVTPPPPVKKLVSQSINNDFNYRLAIGLLYLLTNSTQPEAKFAVHKYV